MRPHGVWVVIAPFNFPLALAGGPVAAALVTGNTVVVKGATDTPWAGRLLADCVRDAGLPPVYRLTTIDFRNACEIRLQGLQFWPISNSGVAGLDTHSPTCLSPS